jgi:hypothetical protein
VSNAVSFSSRLRGISEYAMRCGQFHLMVFGRNTPTPLPEITSAQLSAASK